MFTKITIFFIYNMKKIVIHFIIFNWKKYKYKKRVNEVLLEFMLIVYDMKPTVNSREKSVKSIECRITH